MTSTREIVVPGERLGDAGQFRPGTNTYIEGNDIFALRLGVKSVRGDRVNVISLSGRYEPQRGDMVIGTVVENGPSNWYIDIGSANDVGMHVNDVPWRVEFGETAKYLAVGDSVLLKIVHVDELRKAQVSMKDRQCKKLTGGLIIEVNPARVPRIVGRGGSMIAMLKDLIDVRMFVGQNGVIWIDGEPEDVALALEAVEKIQAEAHTSGLTERMKAWLHERRPQPVEEEAEAEPEGEPGAGDQDEDEEAAEGPAAQDVDEAEEEAADEGDEDDAVVDLTDTGSKDEAPAKKAPAKRGGSARRGGGGRTRRPKNSKKD